MPWTPPEVEKDWTPPEAGAEPAASWTPPEVQAPGQSTLKATGNALAQAAVKGVGHALQGAAAMVDRLPPNAFSEFDTPQSLDQSQQFYEERARLSPAQQLQRVQSDPVYQKGKEIADIAPETYPVDPVRERQLLPKVGEMVGSLLPLAASGPAAPVTIGLESLGSHLDNDFAALKKQDPKLTDDEAAQKTIERGLASGLTQATIFAALPPVLRKAGEKYLLEKFGESALAQFVGGRVAQAAEGGAIGAASAAGENLVSDRPVGEGVGMSAGAMAILQTLTSFPSRTTPRRNLEADALEVELNGQPTGPVIIPPSRQLRKPAIITPPPEPVPTFRPPETLDEIDMFLRDAPALSPEELAPKPKPVEPVNERTRFAQENLAAMAELRRMKEAAQPPVPEPAATLEAQLQLVAEGKTPAMLITPGAEFKAEVPEHLQKLDVENVGQFIFDPTQTSAEQIQTAARENRVGQLLGFGSERKPANGEAVLQTTDANGTPLKDEVVNGETLKPAIEAAQKIAPEGGQIDLKAPEEVVAQRLIPVDFTEAQVKAARTRLGRRSTGPEKRLAVEEGARRELFEQKAFDAKRPNVEPVPVPTLFRGDTVKFGGHEMRVIDFPMDEHGQPHGVTLEGPYGRQEVDATQTLHIDAGSHTSGLEGWADRTIAEGKKKFHSGVDPALLSAYAVKGLVLAVRGAREFGKWSAQMVKEYGEKVRPHLEKIWGETQLLLKGEHPDQGLSLRAVKLMADEGLAGPVRDAIDPRYTKRSNETDTNIAQRLIGEAGGAMAAARDWLDGRFHDAPGSVQTILGSEIQKQLAAKERALRPNDKNQANAIVELQQKLAEADIERATDTAQALQAFRVHYVNWSPSAWLKSFRDVVGRVAADRVSRATGTEVNPHPGSVATGMASAIAEELSATNPKLAKTIEEQFGQSAPAGRPDLASKIQQETGKARAEAEKAAKKISDFYEKEVAKWRKKFHIPEFDAATERDILQRANDLQKLPEDSVQRRDAALDLHNHLRRLKGFSLGELALDFWYANILSGLTTQAKNILGNSVNFASEAGVQMLRNPTAIPQIVEAFGRALPRSAREGFSILRSGRDIQARHLDKFESPGALERIEHPVGSKILLPWKLVGRFLKAADAGFYYPLQEMRAAVLARHQARAEGLPLYSERLNKRVHEILAWTAEAKAKAEQRAAAEGLTGDVASRRASEILEAQRPPLIMENARDFALLGTFNNDPYGVLGAMTQAWAGFAERVPAAKLVIPFTRIVANVTNSAFNWTPVGTYRAGRAQGFKILVGREDNTGLLYGKPVSDPAAIGDLYARSAIGTVALTGLAMAASQYILDKNPAFMVTGSGPNNPDQRELLKEAGWIPYSIKVGDHYYSYADKPLALGLSIVGHYLDAMRYRKLGQQDALNRAAFAVGASADVVLNSSWLQGLSSIFSQASRDSVKTPLKGIPSQALKTASSFVVPNALRQIDEFFDPTKYTADDVRAMLLREIPFARRENHPDLNVFGEPVHAPKSKIFYSKVEGDILIRTLAGRRLWPSVPVAGDLTADEQYTLLKVRGSKLRLMMMQNFATIATSPPTDAQRLVSQLSSEATEQAMDDLGFRPAVKLRREMREMSEK